MGNKREVIPPRGAFFYLGLVIVLIISWVVGHYVQSPYDQTCRIYTVSILVEADGESGLELYHDTGRGFQQKDHQKMTIDIPGEQQLLNFTVPVWREFKKFRIDPLGASVTMKLHGLEVKSQDGSFVHRVALKDIVPIQQIENFHWNGSFFTFETAADASDPMLLIEEIHDPNLQGAERSLAVYALWMLGGLITMMSVNWIYRFFILGL